MKFRIKIYKKTWYVSKVLVLTHSWIFISVHLYSWHNLQHCQSSCSFSQRNEVTSIKKVTFNKFASTIFPQDQPYQFAADGNSSSRHAGNGGVYPFLYPYVHCQLQQQSGKGVFKLKFKVLNLKYCSQ